MNTFIDIKNKNEILRVYENNLKKASSDQDKAKLKSSIANLKMEIGKLEEAEK